VRAALAAAIALSSISALAAGAETYPDRPIRVIVPIAAGSVTDVIMRATASELAPRLGQPFVIENKGGASGIPGAQACAQAAPDGYTLCLVYHNTLSINPLMFNKLPYDADKDFTLITNLYLLVEALFVNEKQAVLPAPGTPAEFASFLKKDRQDAELLIRIANQPREDYKPEP
jgi:tripartite-type tricarboxylate transporter receptor subunit TctC